MAFKPKLADGTIDPNINVNGRPAKGQEKPLTNRQIRERDYLSFLRKIKPHVAESIATAVKIMQCKDASDANKLKAATIILAEYKDALEQTYNKSYDEAEGVEPQPVAQPKAAVFSLTMISNNEDKKE